MERTPKGTLIWRTTHILAQLKEHLPAQHSSLGQQVVGLLNTPGIETLSVMMLNIGALLKNTIP